MHGTGCGNQIIGSDKPAPVAVFFVDDHHFFLITGDTRSIHIGSAHVLIRRGVLGDQGMAAAVVDDKQ